MKVKMLALALLVSGTIFAQKNNPPAKDVSAIKQMCGCFEVTFEFSETFASDTSYKFHDRYKASGLEWVELVDESSNKLALQHLLIVNDSTIIKHWRQDWLYENTDLFRFDRDTRWTKVQLPKSAVKGQWTQKVFQVDDSPRYEGTATWVHVDGRHFWESEADAPLPRREATKRSDYNVLHRVNRHEITDKGWLHEQNNDKIIRSERGDSLLAQERGWNPYVRVPDSRCNAARQWWPKHKEFWSVVRKEWDNVFASANGELVLQSKVDGKALWQYLLSENKAEVKDVLKKFSAPEESKQGK